MSAPRAGGPRTRCQIRDGDWLASRKRIQLKIQSPVPIWSERKRLEAAVSDETIQALRRRIGELDQLARQLDQSGLNNARAQLLLSRKRAEWTTSSTGASDVSTAQMVRPQRGQSAMDKSPGGGSHKSDAGRLVPRACAGDHRCDRSVCRSGAG